jgi:hypothetical protein
MRRFVAVAVMFVVVFVAAPAVGAAGADVAQVSYVNALASFDGGDVVFVVNASRVLTAENWYGVQVGSYGFMGFAHCLGRDATGACIASGAYGCWPGGEVGGTRLPSAEDFSADRLLETAHLTASFVCSDPNSTVITVDITWTGSGSLDTFSPTFGVGIGLITDRQFQRESVFAAGTITVGETVYTFGSTPQLTTSFYFYQASLITPN